MAAALNVGTVLAILLILFVPGYVTVGVFYPTGRRIDWIERIALSIGLSLGIVPLLGLLLNFTPLGVRLVPLLAVLSAYTTGMGALAYWRRMRVPPMDRPSASFDFLLPKVGEGTLVDRALAVGVAASIVVAAAAFAYVLLVPRTGERFTEFYLLGPGGNASGYPTRLNASEPTLVTVGIADRESATVSYTVRVNLLGVAFVYNATTGAQEPTVVNATTWLWINTTLADGQNWTHPYPFSIPNPGSWDVQFVLYKEGKLSAPYRVLNLFIQVV